MCNRALEHNDLPHQASFPIGNKKPESAKCPSTGSGTLQVTRKNEFQTALISDQGEGQDGEKTQSEINDLQMYCRARIDEKTRVTEERRAGRKSWRSGPG